MTRWQQKCTTKRHAFTHPERRPRRNNTDFTSSPVASVVELVGDHGFHLRHIERDDFIVA